VAIVYKTSGKPDTALRAAARETGVVLFRASDSVPWNQLAEIMDAAVIPHRQSGRTLVDIRPGDLFDLANTVAAQAGGAIAIADPEQTTLAYSTLPDQPIDETRRSSMLRMHLPDSVHTVRTACAIRLFDTVRTACAIRLPSAVWGLSDGIVYIALPQSTESSLQFSAARCSRLSRTRRRLLSRPVVTALGAAATRLRPLRPWTCTSTRSATACPACRPSSASTWIIPGRACWCGCSCGRGTTSRSSSFVCARLFRVRPQDARVER
jgi:hypothetical protein